MTADTITEQGDSEKTEPRATALNWTIALASTLGFSIAPPIATLLFRAGVDPTAMLVVRNIIATLLIAVSIAVVAPDKLRMKPRLLAITVGSGFITGVAMLLFFWSLTRIDTSLASMLFSLYPLGVLGLLALRGEKFTYRNIVRLVLGLTGVYLLIGPGGDADWVGVLMVLLSVVASSTQMVAIQWYLQECDGRTVTLYMVGGMTAAIVIWWGIQGVPLQIGGWENMTGILAIAVISTWLARLGMFASVRKLGGGQVALLAPLETLLTVCWAVLFLRDDLSLWQWVGGGLILVSASLAGLRMQQAGMLRRITWRAR